MLPHLIGTVIDAATGEAIQGVKLYLHDRINDACMRTRTLACARTHARTHARTQCWHLSSVAAQWCRHGRCILLGRACVRTCLCAGTSCSARHRSKERDRTASVATTPRLSLASTRLSTRVRSRSCARARAPVGYEVLTTPGHARFLSARVHTSGRASVPMFVCAHAFSLVAMHGGTIFADHTYQL